MTYEYQCSECGAIVCEAREVDDRNVPAPCECGGELKRHYTPPMFTAWLAKDNPDNRIYQGDREDVRRQQKADDIAYEKATAGVDYSRPKTKTVDDILSTGIVDAWRTPEGQANWRREHAPDSELPVNT